MKKLSIYILMLLSISAFIRPSQRPQLTMEQSLQLKKAPNIPFTYTGPKEEIRREAFIRTMVHNPKMLTDIDRYVIHAGKEYEYGFNHYVYILDNNRVDIKGGSDNGGYTQIIYSSDPLSPLNKR